MSLRGHFLFTVVLALLLGLSALGAVACWQARRSVEHEMQMALEAADRVVDNALLSLPREDTDTYLRRLVQSFDGNRHVRVTLFEGGRPVDVSQIAPQEAAPHWFFALLQIPVERREDVSPHLMGRKLEVASDPHNEISESWLQFRDGALALGFFSLSVLLLLYLVMARVTGLLHRLVDGFEAVGGGDYAARVAVKGPRELVLMARAFNRMAERLNGLETANRRMSGQMLAIQEEERADLARDLHDEMGPFLFAMRVDAEAIASLAGEGGIAARARAIGEAVTHIQAHVRAILRQLRPGDLMDVGLAQAITNLATFFQRRHGAIAITLDLAGVAEGFSPNIDAAIYRLVQECLTNAARHSGASRVWIAVAAAASIRVTVQDDGCGFRPGEAGGLGLKGMRERLGALSGSLELSAGAHGGACLIATIPRTRVAVPA